MKLDALTLGHRVEIAPGSVILIDKVTDEMREFPSLADAWEWACARKEFTYAEPEEMP